MGAKVILTDEQKEEVLNQVLQGKSIQAICNHLGINPSTFVKIKNEDPLFKKKFQEYRVNYTEVLEDQLLSVYDNAETIADAQIARGKSDNIKSVLAFRRPEVYGNKIDLNINQTIDLGPVLKAAAERTIPLLEMKQALEINSQAADSSDQAQEEPTQLIEKIKNDT